MGSRTTTRDWWLTLAVLPVTGGCDVVLHPHITAEAMQTIGISTDFITFHLDDNSIRYSCDDTMLEIDNSAGMSHDAPKSSDRTDYPDFALGRPFALN